MKMQNNKTFGPTTFPKRHLFLDTDSLVEWGENIEQKIHQAEKVRITGLECGPPRSWDARCTVSWGSTLFENGLYRKWYCCIPDAADYGEGVDHWLTCYAESEDGIHWRKPDLKLTGQNRWPGNNLLPLPGVVCNVTRPLASMGFKYLAITVQTAALEPDICDNEAFGFEFNGTGTYLFGSDDGLHWKQITKNPVLQHGDLAFLHVDHARQRYLIYQKMAAIHALTPRRSGLVVESKDGIHWEGYEGTRQWQECFTPDDYDDVIAHQRGFKVAEYYSHTIHQIDRLYLDVQNLFTGALPLKCNLGQNPCGSSHFRMAFSHDGKHWRHPRGRPSFLEVGKPGEFDAGFLINSGNILEHSDEQLLYYSALRYGHGWCIDVDFQMRKDIPLEEQRGYQEYDGLAKIKRDRFAGLAVAWKGGFDVEVGPRQGNELTINAQCPNGWVRVAIAEQSARYHAERRKSDSLPGFSFDDCEPFTGDSIKAPVRFKRKRISDLPKDQYLILRFEMMAGEVFGYEWSD